MRLIALFILLSIMACTSPDSSSPIPTPRLIDWQGHRGARGLAPENTIPAFLLALEYATIKTLELDVAISADSQIVVSHEPWMSALICSHPDGRPVSEEEEKQLNLHQMTLADIQAFDCGQRQHPDFPDQRPIPAYKPTLAEVVTAVEARVKNLDRPPLHYNIEIKSRPDWDSIFTPSPTVFADLVLAEVKRLHILKRTTLQSFDVRSLQALMQLDSTLTLAYLIENTDSPTQNLEKLGFIPTIYSPYYPLVSKELSSEIHNKTMLLIPWTVNDTATMRGLIDIGVDGIITDYPNLAYQW